MSSKKKNLISRRTLLIGAGSVVAAGALAWVTKDLIIPAIEESAIARNPLYIPPVIDGTTFDLDLAPSSRQFLSGAKTTTYGYNGESFWGPTLRWKKGDTVSLNVTNNLGEMTSTHWHGIHLPAAADGGPLQMIEVGDTWSPPSFEVKNHAATYWYHPHLHEMTQMQVSMGAGGLIIVDDESEASQALPREYGVDDIPLVLTSRRFFANNAFDTTKESPYGDYLLSNGVLNAETTVPAQLVRFRILNAETERFYNLGFDNDRTFFVVATDGGLLNEPVEVNRLRIVPGERYEIVIDLSGESVGTEFIMTAFNGGMPDGFGGGEPVTSGEFGSLLNNTTFPLLHLKVGAATTNGVTQLPATLASSTMWTAADVTNSRTLGITHGDNGSAFEFDGETFDMNTVNQTVKLNAVEAWTITNNRIFGHAFHIHDVQFSIVSRSTGDVPDVEKGWKDTLGIMPNETVTFIAKFDDYASPTDAYMYHCHMMNHEDGGLMGQFLVVE